MKDSYGIEREQREFYLASGRKVIGYSTPELDYWWVPSEGSTLCIHVHIFDTELEARRHGKQNLIQTIEEAQILLVKTNERISELEKLQ